MADTGARSRAAEYVDAEHRRAHDALKTSHKKWDPWGGSGPNSTSRWTGSTPS
jgi:hypothetical protein